MASTYHTDIQKLYVAYFNRPADYLGLDYWEKVVEAAAAGAGTDQAKIDAAVKASLANISAGFAASAEYNTEYGSQPMEQVIGKVYVNLFGHAADLPGLLYWVGEVQAGRVTLANAVTAIGAGAQGTDLVAFNSKVTAATSFTNALDTGAEVLAYSGAVANAAAKAYIVGVTDAATLAAAIAPAALDATVAAIVTATTPGQSFALTTGVDAFTGGSTNDTFTAGTAIVINPATGAQSLTDTLQGVDTLTGGAGTDTLKINAAAALATASLPTLSGIEVIEVSAASSVTLDTSAVSGLTNLNITKAGTTSAVDATAAATTDVSVSMKAVGATVDVAGGKNVTVNLTDVAAATNVVSVGVGADADAAGTVSVTMTGVKTVAATGATLSAVNVTGGTTISVTQKATSDASAAAADKVGATIVEGAIAVVGNATTTTVTVKQDATVAVKLATDKTGGATETASVKFSALTAGQTIIMGGLTFTASAAMTAAEAAAAFASLAKNAAFAAPASILAGDTQSGGAASKGTYTGVFSAWTSAAASGDTVVFTSTTANSNVTDLANTGTGTATVTTTAGKAHDAGAAGGVLGVTAGNVTVNDVSGAIKTLTIDGVGAVSSTTATAVLETLNLSNAAAAAAMTVADSAATLALNLEKIGTSSGDAVVTITSAPTTLNVKSTGSNYVNLTAALTETLNVSGTGVLKADATDLAALKTVKVSDTAGLTLNAGVADTVTSVDTTGTTGAVTVTIEGARATYTGGAGVDTVTLATNTALTKAINLGAGDDTLSFAALNVTGSTAAVAGGDGTDTLSMATATAAALDAAPVTFYTGFERLTINDAGAANTIDLANLGFTNYVTTSGSAGTLTLDKLANNGTVVLTAAPTTGVTVQVTDAATGTADVLNLVLSSAGNLAAGLLTAANVETVNISTVDTSTSSKNVDSLTLTADKATKVNVTGAQDLALTLTGSTKVTTIDGSAMTGNLTATSLNTTSAATIKGGTGADVLVAATGTTADVLLGGDGNDVLVANAGLTTLTGGAGADVFRIATASLNVNSYATVTDFAAGDLLQLNGIVAFSNTKVTLGATAVFQDFANAAIQAIGNGAGGGANTAAWFQFGGDTYVVVDVADTATTFTNNTDMVVKLTGLVDLTNASFNSTYATLAL